MIVILHPDIRRDSAEYDAIVDYLSKLPGIQLRVHEVQGAQQVLTEIYLLGNTAALNTADIASLAGAAFFLNEARESKVTLFI